MKPVNHLAILVAAVVFFVIGAVWYTVLAQPWLDGIDKTVEQLMKENGG